MLYVCSETDIGLEAVFAACRLLEGVLPLVEVFFIQFETLRRRARDVGLNSTHEPGHRRGSRYKRLKQGLAPALIVCCSFLLA